MLGGDETVEMWLRGGDDGKERSERGVVSADGGEVATSPLLANETLGDAALAGRRHRRVGLAVVVAVLFLDSVLLTCVIPILPAYLSSEGTHDWEIAVLFSSKAIVQLLVNPIAAPLVGKWGSQPVLLLGTAVMVSSSVGFAFGTTFTGLVVARAVQGFGSACSGCAGLTQVAQMFPEDELVGPSMAAATMGIGFGVVLGPPFGGLVYSYAGKQWPFFILAAAGLCSAAVQVGLLTRAGLRRRIHLSALSTQLAAEANPPASITAMLRDGGVRRSCVALVAPNAVIAAIEPAFPLWCTRQFETTPRTVGLVFMAVSIGYLIGAGVSGAVGLRCGRKPTGLVGMVTVAAGVAVTIWPGVRTTPLESIPGLACIGLGAGVVEAAVNPILAAICDNRHPNSEGSAFALADMCFAVAFAVGPLLTAALYAGHSSIVYVCAGAAACTVAAALFFATLDSSATVKQRPPHDARPAVASSVDAAAPVRPSASSSSTRLYEDEVDLDEDDATVALLTSHRRL